MPEQPAVAPPPQTNVSNDAYVSCMDEIERLTLVRDQANGDVRNCIKRWKKEGVDTDAALAACKMRRKDGETVKLYMRAFIRSMALRHMPVSQVDLFEGWNTHISESVRHAADVWEAEDQGYRAGRRSGTDDPLNPDDVPYPQGTEQHAAYAREWRKGQASKARELGPETRQASAARGRPSRAKQERIPGTEERQTAPKRQAPRKKAARKRGNGARMAPAAEQENRPSVN